MEKNPFWSHFTHDKGHFTLLQAYALQKGGGGIFPMTTWFSRLDRQKTTSVHMGGGGVEKPKKIAHMV